MCYEFDALPPIPAIAGAAVDSEDLVLTSDDGTQFAAFVARAEEPGGAGIVVLPDVRGLFRFYEELALRFAENGISAVTIDYFGRTAGVSKRDAEFEYMEHVRQTKADQIADDVAAAVAYLRTPEGGACRSVFTVGFCFGGSNSWLQAANEHDLAGAIGFYGRPGPSFADGSPGPADRAREMTAPILGLMGGADQGIPQSDVDMYRDALEKAGVEHEIVVYDGAPHSFFDRKQEEFAEQSADAWQRVLEFIRRNS
ncbi:MAG: dienelactone hydrolase family protein [Dehalococcoidia bacterium]|nr:dienelactone hydrolase family protein [Dehalococcoidia bacterium]